jgi:hypothetical protein
VSRPDQHVLPVPRLAQQDEVSCGAACLAQVLHYYGIEASQTELAERIRRTEEGGTLAVFIGLLAQDLGLRVRLHPLGLRHFDPTWWNLSRRAILQKLTARGEALGMSEELEGWITLLERGGKVGFGPLERQRLVRILARHRPVIAGLSATWLYRETRHDPSTNQPDDVAGQPVGHFVVVTGYERRGRRFLINDPYPDIPLGAEGVYTLPARRLITAILMGDATRDAVLLEIWPKD